MGDSQTKRYMELQMEELKEAYGVEKQEDETQEGENKHRTEQNAKIAQMYEDAAAYEKSLKGFEEALALMEEVSVTQLPSALLACSDKSEDELRTSLKEMVCNAMKEGKYASYLSKISDISFEEIPQVMSEVSGYDLETVEAEMKQILKREWEILAAVAKEHLDDEIAEIKITGLKPKYAKRVYELYHGIKK